MLIRHRSVRATIAVGFAAIALVALGCSNPTESADASAASAATLTRAGLEMTVAVVPEVVAPSSELTVRLTLTNTARTPSEISLACTSLLRSIGVRGVEQRTLRYLNQRGCYTAVTDLTLASGETRTVEVVFEAVDASESARRPLPPGRYVVDAQPSLRRVNGVAIEFPMLQAGFTVR